jgi:hypothetical protein
LRFKNEPTVLPLLKRFFKDITVNVEFKEIVAGEIIKSDEPFEFECVTADNYSYLKYEGFGRGFFNKTVMFAYIRLVSTALFRLPEILGDIKKYVEYFERIFKLFAFDEYAFCEKRIENMKRNKNKEQPEPGGDEEKSRTLLDIFADFSEQTKNLDDKAYVEEKMKELKLFSNNRIFAAAVYCAVNRSDRRRISIAAEAFGLSESTLRKYEKELNELEKSKLGKKVDI